MILYDNAHRNTTLLARQDYLGITGSPLSNHAVIATTAGICLDDVVTDGSTLIDESTLALGGRPLSSVCFLLFNELFCGLFIHPVFRQLAYLLLHSLAGNAHLSTGALFKSVQNQLLTC